MADSGAPLLNLRACARRSSVWHAQDVHVLDAMRPRERAALIQQHVWHLVPVALGVQELVQLHPDAALRGGEAWSRWRPKARAAKQ